MIKTITKRALKAANRLMLRSNLASVELLKPMYEYGNKHLVSCGGRAIFDQEYQRTVGMAAIDYSVELYDILNKSIDEGAPLGRTGQLLLGSLERYQAKLKIAQLEMLERLPARDEPKTGMHHGRAKIGDEWFNIYEVETPEHSIN